MSHNLGFHLSLLVSSMAASGVAWADCPDDAEITGLSEQILAGEPADLTALALASAEDGRCAQDKLVAILSDHWGEVVGYKAGLTSAAAQAKFGVEEPVAGRLFEDGLLESGARIPADWGALPRFEADLVVEVADSAINDAKTEAEVLAQLSAIYPFIELPDLVVADPKTLTGPAITAINVGARYGVLGEPIPITDQAQARQQLLDALASMQVVARDQNGAELLTAPGTAILGHPLRSVLWLLGQGIQFAPGDLISLGSLGPLLAPEPGLTLLVTYQGLPGDPSVSVRFD